MRRRDLAARIVAIALPALAAAQTAVVVDRVLRHVNADVITTLDVVEARVLHLLPPDVTTDQAIVDALVDRRVELADIARTTPAEPAAADVAARRDRWHATLGPRADLPALLARAGITDAALTAWFRDDAIIETYENQHLAGVPPTRDDLQAFYRDHPSDFRAADGTRRPADDPAVQASMRSRIAAARKDAAVAAWVASLRNRADIW